MNEEVIHAHIAELTKQRNALQAQVLALSAIVYSVPRLIIGARLDAKEGKHTHYDYVKHEHALNFRNFYQF
jgi:hypothetical protein